MLEVGRPELRQWKPDLLPDTYPSHEHNPTLGRGQLCPGQEVAQNRLILPLYPKDKPS